MRLETQNTRTLRLAHNTGSAVRFTPARGPQGLPGPGSAAWAADTAVTTGAVRQAPDGSWIKSTGNRTTRPSFDTAEATFWEAVLASSGTVEATALTAAIDAGVEAGIDPLLGEALTMPAGFPTLPCDFYRDRDGGYSHDFDFTPYKSGGTEVHVKMGGRDSARVLGTTAAITIVTGGDLVVSIDGGGNQTITLANGDTAGSCVTKVNAVLGAGSAALATIGGSNYFQIQSLGTGDTTSVQVVSGGGTILSNLGLAVETKTVDGSAAGPYRTLKKAMAKVLAAAAGTYRIITDVPMLFRDESDFTGTLTAKTVSLISTVPGGTLLTSNAGSTVPGVTAAYTWTLGAAGTYSTSRSGVTGVLDAGVRDANGMPVALVKVTTVGECEATPGTWAQSGSTLYVHRRDRQAPTAASTVVTISVTGFDPVLASGSHFYAENMIFCGWANGNGLRVRGAAALTGGETFVAQRCGFIGTTANGYMTYQVAKTHLFDCVAAYGQLDGFNYSYDSIAWATVRANSLVTEFNCKAYHLGIETPGAGSNNASTGHGGVNVLRIAGDGSENTGATVIDVNGCRSVLFGYKTHTPVTSGVPGIGTTYMFSADSAPEPAEVWMYDCAAEDSTVALSVGSNSTAHLARFRPGAGTVGGAGTILYDI